MQTVLAFPLVTDWPPPLPYFDVVSDFGTWIAPDQIRIPDPGTPTSFFVDPAFQDAYDGSTFQVGFKLVNFDPLNPIVTGNCFMSESVNGRVLSMTVAPNNANLANSQVIIADGIGGSVNIAPIAIAAGDTFALTALWSAGHWTVKAFKNGVQIGTPLVSVAALDPTGQKINTGFNTGSIGGVGQPGFSVFGDVTVYFTIPPPPAKHVVGKLQAVTVSPKQVESDKRWGIF